MGRKHGGRISIRIGGDATGAKITAVSGDLNVGRWPARATTSLTDNSRAQQAYEMLCKRFSLDEINGLCFEMGIAPDDLGGDTRPARARALVQQAVHLNKLDRLLELIRRERPR